ncbi:MAG: ferritin-like domain-containing protein [Marmoricola sp.]|nr:ferritin-like domain-containing protein [Marmoricola sp.]
MTPVEALQKTLAAEHAAVFLYGVLGARTSGSQDRALLGHLQRTFADHRAQRDALTVLVSAHDADPVPSLVDYALPGPVSTPAQVVATARTIEQRVTRTYGELVASTAGTDRRWAIGSLDRSALREASFGAQVGNFPGLD